MIAEAIIAVGLGVINFFLGVLPDSDPPAWLLNASAYLGDAWGYAAGLGAWIPWPMVGAVFSAVMVCVGLGFLIKVTRIIASFLTVGGGSAG